ncbi:MAG: beta-lactamase family protein [Deltaproteobacteria bacterium]|nr:beta-lactamase family protein [Deltaproteobacteria bacterium]
MTGGAWGGGVRAVLEDAVARGVTPGAQVAVWDGGALRSLAVGRVGYSPEDPPVTEATVFDLASVTKPFTALGWVLSGRDLGVTAAALVPAFRGEPAATATLEALLTHRAGLAAWAPLYALTTPEGAGSGAAREAMLAALLASPREAPEGERYSDLGYLLAGEVLARVEGAPLQEVVTARVLAPFGCEGPLGYRGVGAPWRGGVACAPTERCAWRGRVVRGEVHDENAFAYGGVAGHAGLFGTAEGLCRAGVALLEAYAGGGKALSREALLGMLAPRPGGTHRVGFDTRSDEGSSTGRWLGPRTFGHLGFTGTSLWCDPDAGVAIALTTNRVHPSRDNLGIRALRPAVHDAVCEALGRRD